MKPASEATVRRFSIVLAAMTLAVAACSDASDSTTTTAARAPTTQPATTLAPTSTSPATTTTTHATTTSAAPTTSSAAPPDGSLAIAVDDGCPGVGAVPDSGAVTWAEDGQILQSTNAGPACLLRYTGTVTSLEWSADGSRLLVNDLVLVDEAGVAELGSIQSDAAKLTAPTGLNAVLLADGGLRKWVRDTGEVVDVSALSNHTAVAYHPTGLHMATAGLLAESDDIETEGVFVTDGDGADPVVLATGHGLVIPDVEWSADASALYFIAEHDNEVHLHLVDTVPFDDEQGGRILGSSDDSFAPTLDTTARGEAAPTQVVTHPSDPTVAAWTTDPCGDVLLSAVTVRDTSSDQHTAKTFEGTSTVGLFATFAVTLDAPCGTPGTLTLLSYVDESELRVSEAATAAAVRIVRAEPVTDLVDVDIVGFA